MTNHYFSHFRIIMNNHTTFLHLCLSLCVHLSEQSLTLIRSEGGEGGIFARGYFNTISKTLLIKMNVSNLFFKFMIRSLNKNKKFELVMNK